MSYKRLTSLINFVQKFEETLTFQLRQNLPDATADDIPVSDEAPIGSVRELKSMLRPRKHRHEAWCLREKIF